MAFDHGGELFVRGKMLPAKLDLPVVGQYMLQSSDGRSFKIRPPVKIPEYNPASTLHKILRDLSIQAHKYHDDTERMKEIDIKLDEAYLAIL